MWYDIQPNMITIVITQTPIADARLPFMAKTIPIKAVKKGNIMIMLLSPCFYTVTVSR